MHVVHNHFFQAFSCCSHLDRDGGDAIKVLVRARPPLESDPKECLYVEENHNRIVVQSVPKKVFSFDQVMNDNVSQVLLNSTLYINFSLPSNYLN